MSKIKTVIDSVVTVAILVACGVVTYSFFPKTKPSRNISIPKAPQSLLGAQVKGRLDASVALIEFSDFECPFCGTFAKEVWPELDRLYVDTGRIVVAFRHNPLTTIHKKALGAAKAAECAGTQGKFWQMHNSLFADQKELDPVSLAHRFEALGGDMRQFSSCVEAPETEAKVLSDSAMATELGLTLTPTFFAGIIQADGQVKVSKVIVGTKPLTDFTSVIDALLK